MTKGDDAMSKIALLLVVAVALIDREGQILVQQRPPSGTMPGLWEFPGGKVEPGETPEAGLVRELAEELGIHVEPDQLAPVGFISHPQNYCHLLLLLYKCQNWSGDPHALHATMLCWHPLNELRKLAMPPADLPLLDALEKSLAPTG